MPGFLSPGGKGMPLLLIPEYSGINKGRRIPDTGLHSLAGLLYLSQTSYADKLTLSCHLAPH